MKVEKPNHWLLDILSTDEFEEAFDIADTRLVYSSLEGCFDIKETDYNLYEEDNEKITRVIKLLELVIVDLQDESLTSRDELEIELTTICQYSFILLRALDIPNNCIERIKYIYKIITYSYMGEQWESGRRFIIENEKLCKIEVKEEEDWNITIFKRIYLSFLYLVRKDSWNDFNKAMEYISELREQQTVYERLYLDSLKDTELKNASYELFSLYHLAKAVDVMAQFMSSGEPLDIRHQIDFHFGKAIESTDIGTNIEMNLILKMLLQTSKKMISNSIWMVTQKVNSRVTKFVQNITSSNKPVYELMYPQKLAILKKGLLDPAHKAIIVNMPTSSGKTLISEFRMLQALNQFSDDNGWVAYIAPTRALVNQITTKLKRDLGQIDIKVEKMSGAIDLDYFEESLLTDEEIKFNILVTTPEKFNLLIRENVEEKIGRPLALLVIDEAHNLEVKDRGINLELMIANVKHDCPKANFLLLTPFIPNSMEIAKWIDPDSPNSISLELNWKPNDRVIGAIYPEGERRQWTTIFESLLTSSERIQIEKKIRISKYTPIDEARSKLTNNKLALAVTKQIINREGILVICRTIGDCWKLANDLANEIDESNFDEDIELVKRFISNELGENFALISLLDKRIGVHNSGLPEEVKYLMEWLMEKRKLRVLVATTTIAQGINFPVSSIIMASYTYPYMTHMPVRDFWNLVGRSGRTEQGTLGLVGIVAGSKRTKKEDDLRRLRSFVKKSTEDLISSLSRLVDNTIQIGEEFDLASNFYNPEWSQFMQYITHMFNQCEQLSEFNAKTELFLRGTLGYSSINPNKQKILIDSIKTYGQKLNEYKGLAKISDSTGFSMEAIMSTMIKVKDLDLDSTSWVGTSLFSKDGNLRNLMGIMLTIPEIKSNLVEVSNSKGSLTGEILANITLDWIDGKEMDYIANQYFNGNDSISITDCCKAIYSKLINSATWGLSSIQKLPNSGLDFDNMSEEELKRIRNLPAMIYYGVNSDEAVLMRINNIPRSIASDLGHVYKSQVSDIYKSTTTEVSNWLKNQPTSVWDNAVNNKEISGSDYKRVWGILNGEE